MASTTIRPAQMAYLRRLTEIQNYSLLTTHVTFDVQPHTAEQRVPWFHEHSDGRRYRLLVAEDLEAEVLGYACTGRFRPKEAYETTVEVSIACSPNATGRGIS